MIALEGGYVLHALPAMLRGVYSHTSALPGKPVSDADLRATNLMSSTAWATNRAVAWTARHLLAIDAPSPVVPGNVLVPVPLRLPGDDREGYFGEDRRPGYSPEDFKALSEADRKRFVKMRGDAHKHNASVLGSRRAFVQALDTATDMEEFPEYYFNVQMDFRLRRYTTSAGGLNPQGDDFNKSILHFAHGKALGASGLYWLCVRAANCYGAKTPEAPKGLDKAHPDVRYGWALDNLDLFRRIAANPANFELWALTPEGKPTEEPWGFLATALELAQAFDTTRPEEFESHLAVPLDGSCNGLQHLSAMGRDPIGALATNLCAVEERHDVYLTVAEAARKIVENDAAKGRPEALEWYGKVDRNSVKRAVLATPYGVTDGGIARQLIEDDVCPESDKVEERAMAAYFKGVIVDSLAGTVVGAKSIMKWLQDCATNLAAAGLPMDWVTPMGSTCRQAYYARTASKVQTLSGTVTLSSEVAGGMLDKSKQMLGSAPQIVHSFDAAHLAATVNLCADMGISSFAMIHDSFGTYAADTPTMNAALRETFVAQYKVNRLAELAEGFRSRAPHVEIPEPPALGDFDVAANVPNSTFFFS